MIILILIFYAKCPKLELVLNCEWMKLSDGCHDDLLQIKKDPSIDRVAYFYWKYGMSSVLQVCQFVLF